MASLPPPLPSPQSAPSACVKLAEILSFHSCTGKKTLGLRILLDIKGTLGVLRSTRAATVGPSEVWCLHQRVGALHLCTHREETSSCLLNTWVWLLNGAQGSTAIATPARLCIDERGEPGTELGYFTPDTNALVAGTKACFEIQAANEAKQVQVVCVNQ